MFYCVAVVMCFVFHALADLVCVACFVCVCVRSRYIVGVCVADVVDAVDAMLR